MDWRHKRRHWYQGWYQPNMPTTRAFSAFFGIKGASKGVRWRNWHQLKHNYPSANKAPFYAGLRSALPSEVEGQRRTKAPALSPASKSNFAIMRVRLPFPASSISIYFFCYISIALYCIVKLLFIVSPFSTLPPGQCEPGVGSHR